MISSISSYGRYDNVNALNRIREDMDLRAHNIANSLTYQTQLEKNNSTSSELSAPDRTTQTQESNRYAQYSNTEENLVKLKEDETYYQANAKTIKINNDVLGKMLDIQA